MDKMKIFVTGAAGQLGCEVHELVADYPQFQFIFFGRATMPIEDADAVNTFFAREKPEYCINCAAYTAVDKAESEKETAFLINGDAVANLATACRDNNTR